MSTTEEHDSHIPLDQVFTLDEAAARLRCKKPWLRSQLSGQRFPGRKIANKWHVTEADIQEILEILYSAPIFRPRPDPVSARPGTRRHYERRNRRK